MIFFDNASTTKCSSLTIECLTKFGRENYFNPSSMYHEGIEVKKQIEFARETILRLIKGDGRVVFTSGGSESDNLALFGSHKPKGSRIIISATEHAAVYASAMELKQRGYDVVLCPTDSKGCVIEEAFDSLMTKETSLVSIIHVNNETGGINDIKRLSAIAKAKNPKVIFHSDGVQAFGKLPLNMRALGVDLYSMSAHKINAPKGVGGLYVKNGVTLSPIIFGGGQENGLRSSTENVGGIVAFSKMAQYMYDNLTEVNLKASEIKDKLMLKLKENGDIVFISDDTTSNFILTFTSDKVRGEVMQHALEREDILVGTGSACASNKATKRIAEAIGLKGKFTDGIVRLSFGRYNSLDEVDEFINKYERIYKELSKYGS